MSSTSPQDLTKWTVAQLKAELSKHDLETRGVKADLVARLKNFRQLSSKLELSAAPKKAKQEEEQEEPDLGKVQTEEEQTTEEPEENVANGDEEEKIATTAPEDGAVQAEEDQQASETEGRDGGVEDDDPESETKEESMEHVEQDSSAMIVLEEEGDTFDETLDQEHDVSMASTASDKKEEEEEQAVPEKATDTAEEGVLRRPELIQEARRTRRAFSFYLYPISTEDLDSDDLKPYMRKCVHVHYKCLAFGLRQEKLAGCLELQMKTTEDVDEAEESLKNWKEDIRVVRLRPTDENICDIVADLMGFPGNAPVRHDLRTMVIQNLPESVKEDRLEELFPGCNVTLGQNAEGKLTGNAFLEFINVSQVEAAVAKCKDLELDGVKVTGSLISSSAGWARDWTDGSSMQKPLSLNTLKKIVNQAVRLRVTIASSWQETQRETDNKRKIEKVKDLETRLEKNALVRRKRHLPDPDMWRRLRQDWIKKSCSTVDRNHQHLLSLDPSVLTEKLQKKLDRRAERKQDKSATGGEKEGEEKGKKSESEKTEKGEGSKDGKAATETKKTEGDRSKAGPIRRRNQRDVQRDLTVTVSNNMGGFKRQGSRQHDSGAHKRMRPDRSPMGGSRYNQRGASGRGGGRTIGSLTGNRGLGSGNYSRSFNRSGSYGNQSYSSRGGMNASGSVGRDFSSSQMGMQGMGNRGMMGNNQDTSNALNLLVGLSQMLSKQGGQNPLGGGGGVGGGGSAQGSGSVSMSGYNQGGSDFRGSSSGGSYDNRGGYNSRGGYFEDRQGNTGHRMGDLDQRSYSGSSLSMDGNYGSRYGGGSGSRW